MKNKNKLQYFQQFFLILSIFGGINSCSGSFGWNLPPKTHKKAIDNKDAHTDNPTAEIVAIESVVPQHNMLTVKIIIKSPGENVEQGDPDVFTLAFYEANDLIPKDLNNVEFGNMLKGACNFRTGELTIEVGAFSGKSYIPKNLKIQKPDIYTFLSGRAVTLFVGKQSRNSLYVLASKLPLTISALGKGFNGVEGMTNFNVGGFQLDPETLSPITDVRTGRFIYNTDDVTESGTMSLSGGFGLMSNAPPFTLGTKVEKNYEGLLATHKNPLGSEYEFNVHINPSARGYYVVLSKVVDIMGALLGKYSLIDTKVYKAEEINSSNPYNVKGTKDYNQDCSKNIHQCGSLVNPM